MNLKTNLLSLELLYEKFCKILSDVSVNPKIGKYIYPNSTPILFFGNIKEAKIATVGINPANGEFSDPKKKRFLHASEIQLSSPIAEEINKGIELQLKYFENRPYEFFEKFESLLNLLGFSYYENINRRAVHLDIVIPFATKGSKEALEVAKSCKSPGIGFSLIVNLLELHPEIKIIIGIGKDSRWLKRGPEETTSWCYSSGKESSFIKFKTTIAGEERLIFWGQKSKSKNEYLSYWFNSRIQIPEDTASHILADTDFQRFYKI